MVTLHRLLAAMLVLTGLMLAGCDGQTLLGGSDQITCSNNFSSLLPADWKIVSHDRLEPDNNSELVCIVFYRFDIKNDKEPSPVGGVVVRQDRNRPHDVHTYPLHLPEGFYLGENQVSAYMEDVLSGQVAKELREQKEPRELIVEDRIGSLIVEASIFSWSEEDKSEESQYESLGWFKGDGGVTIDLNRVTVRVRQRNTRSQLADRFVYKARDNKTYYQENSTKLVLPDMTDWVSLSMPEDPATSEYPEKVVLAFYQNITDANKLKGLMTSDAYEALQKSDAVFDCLSQRTGALVKNMDYSQALSVPTHTENSNISITVTVSATSTCLVNDRPSGKELKLTWQVRWDKYDDKGNDKDTWILLKPKP